MAKGQNRPRTWYITSRREKKTWNSQAAKEIERTQQKDNIDNNRSVETRNQLGIGYRRERTT